MTGMPGMTRMGLPVRGRAGGAGEAGRPIAVTLYKDGGAGRVASEGWLGQAWR